MYLERLRITYNDNPYHHRAINIHIALGCIVGLTYIGFPSSY